MRHRPHLTTLLTGFVPAVYLFLSPNLAAQEIFISNIEGTFAPGKVSPGETITVTIAVDNSGAPANMIGLGLGWELNGQGGATWDTVVVGEPASFDFYDYFDFLRQHYWFTPPAGLDTVAVIYSRLFAAGIPVDDSVEIFDITFGPVDGPLGATIILDSVAYFGPAQNPWETVVDPPPQPIYPTFDAMTFEIAECCQGTVGNVAGIPDEVNLTDVTVMANSLFRDFAPLNCPAEANASGDPQGDINLTDLTVLVNHLFITFEPLPPCP